MSLAVPETPHILRLKGVIDILKNAMVENPAGGMGKLTPVFSMIADELAEEMRDLDEMTIRVFLFQIGEVVSWIGHGDNERLPESLLGWAELIQPTVRNANDTGSQSGTYQELDSATG